MLFKCWKVSKQTNKRASSHDFVPVFEMFFRKLGVTSRIPTRWFCSEAGKLQRMCVHFFKGWISSYLDTHVDKLAGQHFSAMLRVRNVSAFYIQLCWRAPRDADPFCDFKKIGVTARSVATRTSKRNFRDARKDEARIPSRRRRERKVQSD